jgi:hypothetical protein
MSPYRTRGFRDPDLTPSRSCFGCLRQSSRANFNCNTNDGFGLPCCVFGSLRLRRLLPCRISSASLRQASCIVVRG